MDKLEVNARVVRMCVTRALLKCAYCKPHRGENEGRRPKHGAKKARKRR